MSAAWADPVYRRTAIIVLSIIFSSGILVFFLRRKNHYFMSAWASINHWLIAGPALFILFGLPSPWPVFGLSVIAIYGAKAFFKIMGLYQESVFVLICYAGILGLALCSYLDRLDIYNVMPLIVLGICCFVPLIRNNYKRMIQYISLTLLGFIFLGWSFMHLGLLLRYPTGLYQIMYLIILTEFCDNTNLAIGRYFKSWRLFPLIDPKRTLGSTLVSVSLTLALAFVMRQLLPDQSDLYWYTTGLIASFGGLWGDLVMSVVRRDAGVRIVGSFILGRGDFLHRMDRLIFVAPLYYYVMRAIS
ncbi:MAG: phosphatidate cytidylyltransferase [Bdellovibrionaceae bacterium]|jgi:phosphatidate cytidylyltransferase|nr:phosphatidate cytidylyltransferase [Pseudobdellovibrionaceae bacterium]